MTALLVLAILCLLGASLLTIGGTEAQIAANELEALQALYVAEAGLATAVRDLLTDLSADPAGAKPRAEQQPAEHQRLQYLATAPRAGACPAGAASDADGQRTGRAGLCYYDLGPGALQAGALFRIPYGEVRIGPGTFLVELAHAPEDASMRRLLALATGRSRLGAERRIEAHLEVQDLGAWSNAIFTQSRLALPPGTVVAGSLHVLGAPGGRGEGGSALELRGAQVWNHFEPAGDGGSGIGFLRVPGSVPPRYLAERLDASRPSLGAEVRVNGGITASDAAGFPARLGEPPDAGAAMKTALDGVYATADLGALAAQGRLYADTGLGSAYVTPARRPFTFPPMGDAGGAVPAEAIAGPLSLGGAYGCDAPPGAAPLRLCPEGSRWVLEVNGLVRVDGNLTLGSEAVRSITLRGRGTLASGGELGGQILVRADLVPADHDPGNATDRCGGVPCFPRTDALGLVARTALTLAAPDGGPLTVAGAFYAGARAVVLSPTRMAGALVAESVDIQAPDARFFQVPSLGRHLPPGLPGSAPLFRLRLAGWRELIP